MISFPFTAQPVYNSNGVLTGYDRSIGTKSQRNLNKLQYTQGIDAKNPNAFRVLAGEGMTVVVVGTTGTDITTQAWAHLDGTMAMEEAASRTLALEAADSLDRIDRVILRKNDTDDDRDTDLYILKGTPADTPVAPTLTQNVTVWEIAISDVFVPSNSTAVAQSRITDQRLNAELCGTMNLYFDAPNMQPYFTQIQALIDGYQAETTQSLADLQAAIDAIEIGSTTMLTNVYATNGEEGKVDAAVNADKLGGNLPSYYATAQSVENIVDGTTAVGEATNADNGFKLYTQSGGTLSGDGNFGYFTASGSGTYNTLTIGGSSLAVKCGEETEIELVDGVMYQFIIDDASGTINFKPASGLKLKVVGGSDYPVSPSENTIWIGADVTVGKTLVSATEPTVRKDGTDLQTSDVWVCTGGNGYAVANNGVTVYVRWVARYNGTNFVPYIGYIYQDGAWKKLTFYLLKDSCFFMPFTNGYSLSATKYGTSGTGTATASMVTSTTAKIDATNLSTLKISYNKAAAVVGNINGASIYGGIGASNTNTTYTKSASAAINSGKTGGTSSGTLTIDVSAYTGEYYIKTHFSVGNYSYGLTSGFATITSVYAT